MALAVASAMSLWGCGGLEGRSADRRAAEPIVSTCSVAGLGTVRGEVALDCATFSANFVLVRKIMNDRGILPEELDNVKTFSDIPVLVIADTYVELPEDETLYNGFYVSTTGVTLAGTDDGTDTLLHELLHALQVLRAVMNTNVHPDWDKNGFYAADAEYQQTAARVILE